MALHVERMTRTWKNTRYKYLVCLIDFYYSLKDFPCCSEWIGVCYKWVLNNMQWVIYPFHLYGRRSKTLERAN